MGAWGVLVVAVVGAGIGAADGGDGGGGDLESILFAPDTSPPLRLMRSGSAVGLLYSEPSLPRRARLTGVRLADAQILGGIFVEPEYRTQSPFLNFAVIQAAVLYREPRPRSVLQASQAPGGRPP